VLIEQGLAGIATGEGVVRGRAEAGLQHDQAGHAADPDEQGEPPVPVTGPADPSEQTRPPGHFAHGYLRPHASLLFPPAVANADPRYFSREGVARGNVLGGLVSEASATRSNDVAASAWVRSMTFVAMGFCGTSCRPAAAAEYGTRFIR
jgi:hypothetical protein